MSLPGYAADTTYAQTGLFRALVAEVVRRWPSMDHEDLIRVLALDGRRYNMAALQEGGPFEARQFADRVLGIHSTIVPNVGHNQPQLELVGQNRYDYTVFRRAFDGIPPWTQGDVDRSMSEGWLISSQYDGTEQIQKYDEDLNQRFDADQEAVEFVDKRAAMCTDMNCIYSRAVRCVAHSHGAF